MNGHGNLPPGVTDRMVDDLCGREPEPAEHECQFCASGAVPIYFTGEEDEDSAPEFEYADDARQCASCGEYGCETCIALYDDTTTDKFCPVCRKAIALQETAR